MFKKTRHDNAGTEREDSHSQPDAGEPRPDAAPASEDGEQVTSTSTRASREEQTGAETEIEKLRRESQENLQNWKRATADYQNLRRRLQGDIDVASQRSKQPLLLDLLLVLDYLEMALKTPCTTLEGKNLSAGVELTRSVLLRTLERENVHPVPETGPFDAAVHQAVESVETAAHKSGTILGTLRRGYTCNGQVIRPAQVRVAVEPSTERAARTDTASSADGSPSSSSDATEI